MQKLLIAVFICAALAFGATSTLNANNNTTGTTGGLASPASGIFNYNRLNPNWLGQANYRQIAVSNFDTSTLSGPVTAATVTHTANTTVSSDSTGCYLSGDFVNTVDVSIRTAAYANANWWFTEQFHTRSFYVRSPASGGAGTQVSVALTAIEAAKIRLGSNTVLRTWMECSSSGATANWEGTVSFAITYTPPNTAPVNVSSSGLPANFNIGTEQTVVATVRDADGYANINYFHVLLNYGVDGGYSCYLLIYPNSNYFHLMNDAGDSWGSGYTFGVAGTAANGSCSVNAATSSRSVSGTDATVTLQITFLPGVFSRPSRPIAAVNSYLWVMDAAAAGQVWGGPYQQATARSGPKLIVTRQR